MKNSYHLQTEELDWQNTYFLCKKSGLKHILKKKKYRFENQKSSVIIIITQIHLFLLTKKLKPSHEERNHPGHLDIIIIRGGLIFVCNFCFIYLGELTCALH